MSNAFNPFAPQAQQVQQPVQFTQPVQQAPANGRPQKPIPKGLNDAAPSEPTNFGPAYFKHIAGDWDVKITGYSGVTRDDAPKKGIHCSIMLEVLTSSCPDAVPVGSTWRIGYQYDWQRVNPDGSVGATADKDTFGKDVEKLSGFILAVFGRKQGDGFDARAAERYLREGFTDPNTKQHTPAPDLTVAPMFAHLHSWLSKPKERNAPTGGKETVQYRNDRWSPKAA